MKTFTILVDMDDTIENLCEVWVQTLNEKYDRLVKPTDLIEWDINKFFPGLTQEQIYAPLNEAEFWMRVKPYRDAQFYLKKLIDDGHKVMVVTASQPDTVAHKLKHVLFEYFPYLSYHDVIICANKQLIKGDYLVDDGVHNLMGGEYNPILMDAPHNKYFDNKKAGIPRVYNWKQIYSLISKAAKIGAA